MNTPTWIIVHHSNGSVNDAKASTQHHSVLTIDDTHRARWPGFTSQVYKNERGQYYHVGYHKVFLPDGTVVRTRADHEEGAHCIGLNTASLGYLIVGNFTDGSPDEPTFEQEKSVHAELMADCAKYSIPVDRIVPHRRFASYKDCFGSKLLDTYGQSLYRMSAPEHDREELKKKIDLLTQLIHIYTVMLGLIQARAATTLGSIMIRSSFREKLSQSYGWRLQAKLGNEQQVSFMQYPEWYKSSAGPGVSSTLTNIALSALPVLNMFMAQADLPSIGDGTVSALIGAVVFVVFAVRASIGYVRAKRTLGAKIVSLGGSIE